MLGLKAEHPLIFRSAPSAGTASGPTTNCATSSAVDWINTFLVPAIEAEKKGVGSFYFDQKKAARYNALSKKEGIIPTGFAHNIAEAGINVKPQTETLQFKRWFVGGQGRTGRGGRNHCNTGNGGHSKNKSPDSPKKAGQGRRICGVRWARR